MVVVAVVLEDFAHACVERQGSADVERAIGATGLITEVEAVENAVHLVVKELK